MAAWHLYVRHYGGRFLSHVLFSVPYAGITKLLFDIVSGCYHEFHNCLHGPLDYEHMLYIIGLFIVTGIAQWFLHSTPFYPHFDLHLFGLVVVLFPYMVLKTIGETCGSGTGHCAVIKEISWTKQRNMLYIAPLSAVLWFYIMRLYNVYFGPRYMLRGGSPGTKYDE